MITNEEQKKISEMILSYLQRNPDAGDTLEGILRWWLGFENIESSVEDVANALETLIQERVIERYSIVDGTTFYKINKQR